MKLFDVYPLYNVTPVKAKGIEVWDDKGEKYLDFYGGHAVISIGHTHPHYVKRIKEQLEQMAFYSNSVQNPLQQALAEKLGQMSGCEDYDLFMCNSGAEANENALKMASFHTGKSKVIAFTNSFHGRTSAAVAATDNPSINAPINKQQEVTFLPLNDVDAFEKAIESDVYCAVIIEAIQGVGGLDEPTTEFFQFIAKKCKEHNIVLIADEVQSGYGRSGKFFAFQHHLDTERSRSVQPDIISIAKGMGNGFPVGGILIHESFKPSYGLLGTTFGGNHLACAASLAVLEVLENENLMANAAKLGSYFKEKAAEIPEIKKVKGRGLMIGLEFDFEVADLRKKMILEQHMFTGSAKNKKLLRFLPALNITKEDIDLFFEALKKALS
ncbi:MAG: aminotransferase class III-fold pyridoxal phosphate-dependent enzyme [Muricauda sp.]|jgi:acetylornithine aminotransferase|nr:aminotransferase class III-fold pyridoxal phosphate-dependent enzyme [Allomuricauda sp.]MBO6533227.1 aminotransferase class III-fold pyridoxal phosphate-dependent enzyme [Allomuricauda sp.]MBO6587637.1 aminotransferase class III-fold pyridoxal phosphate-dependent enzyme [Allomuricauda sp.]MBO6617262.1 aminotransferase class III-fold pyridoxal phosphate-dependent enzyme [Allomuricauda sp.]MBO6643727.1 aminotransferase class III-fold pyridoxal phosphate-dependent enzyme [Allomuricauda sp.]MBO